MSGAGCCSRSACYKCVLGILCHMLINIQETCRIGGVTCKEKRTDKQHLLTNIFYYSCVFKLTRFVPQAIVIYHDIFVNPFFLQNANIFCTKSK